MEKQEQWENLRRKMTDELSAGAFSGLGAMILDEEEVRMAGPQELEELARRYGIK